MNTKIAFGIAAILGLLSVCAHAQVTVSTSVSPGVLLEPYDVSEDANGNLFISDSVNNRIVRVDATTQAATVLAGVTGVAGSNDGTGAGLNPAHFSNPEGLLTVSIGGTNGLLVADSGNNLIRFVRFSDGYVTTLAGQSSVNNGINNETGVNASFNVPAALDQDTNGNVYIADEFQDAIRVINLNDPAFGVTNLVMTDGTTFHHPSALAFVGTNQLWVADSYNNSVKLVTLSTPTSGTLTTYLGSNSSHAPGSTDSAYGPSARFNNPSGLFWINGVGLLISDTGNNTIRLATNNPAFGATNYSVITYAGIAGTSGNNNGSALSATFNQPVGLCGDPANSAFLVTDLGNNIIRSIQYGVPRPHVPSGLAATATYGQVNLTWNSSLNATSYRIKRSPSTGGPYSVLGVVATTTFSDTDVMNGMTYYYVVSALNSGGESANSAEASATAPWPPVPDPQVGYFDFPPNAIGSVFHPVSIFSFYNDVYITVKGTPGTGTFYTSDGSVPSSNITNSASIPSDYQDGLDLASAAKYVIPIVAPTLTISAIGVQTNRQNSAVVTGTFQFIAGNPSVIGNNAAQFAVNEITIGAHLYRTIDGSDPSPTNYSRDLGVVANSTNLINDGFPIITNTVYKIRAFKNNYLPSAVVSVTFSPSNYLANIISFGFGGTQEASSDFIASAGQSSMPR